MIIRNKFNGYVGGNNRLYPAGGGGSQPTNTTQTTTTIPEYAKPYVERMLGKAEAFSDSPYQAYGGERVAGFTPMQEQAFQGAANLGPTQQIGMGTQLAGLGGLGGLGAGQQYAQQATNPYAMQSYMSPFIEGAMAPQLKEAQRRSLMQGQQNQAAAVQQGAFGGSRTAIVEAERQRNLAEQQGDIYGKGMQTAFEQARQAQQFGADLGLRGYGLAGQMAGTLGQLGQTQFGQQQGAIQAQAAAGAQQQGLEQQRMSQAYQDFLSQRGYPQQQLAFMSDILRGVPLGQQTQVQYQAPPPMASQLAQLGLGAYGASQMFKKEGGIIKMAEGGIAGAAPQGDTPTTVPIDKLRSMLGRMDEEQLAQVEAGTSDVTTLALVQEQRNLNERIRNSQVLSQSLPEGTIQDEIVARNQGIAAAPIPESMFGDTAVGERYAPAEEEEASPAMARGGIVAFAKGKEVKAPADDTATLRAMDPKTAFATPEERKTSVREGIAFMDELMGPDKTLEMAEKIAKASEISPKAESQAKAAAAFEAMAAFGEPVPFATALGKAGAAAGRNIKEYEKLKREADREANKLRLDTARYERAEKRGKISEARQIADKMEDRNVALYNLEVQKTQALAQMTQAERLAMEGFKVQREGHAVTRAGQFNLDRDFLSIETQKGIEDYRAREGKDPVGKDLADIRSAAVTKVAEMRRMPNPYGAANVDVGLQNAITSRIKADPVLNKLEEALGMARLRNDQAKVTALEAEIQVKQQAVINKVIKGVKPTPGAGDTTPPPATTQALQPGQIVVDANGNRAKYVGGDPKDPKSYVPV
jgi:hypothetical protein